MPYRVIRRLGRGGMGVVDLAQADDGSEVYEAHAQAHVDQLELAAS